QLVFESISIDDASDISAQVTFEDVDLLASRLGVRFANSSRWGDSEASLVTVWLRPNWWHDFLNGPTTELSSISGLIPFHTQLDRDWVNIEFGATGMIAAATSIYGEAAYESSLNGSTTSYELNVGLKTHW